MEGRGAPLIWHFHSLPRNERGWTAPLAVRALFSLPSQEVPLPTSPSPLLSPLLPPVPHSHLFSVHFRRLSPKTFDRSHQVKRAGKCSTRVVSSEPGVLEFQQRSDARRTDRVSPLPSHIFVLTLNHPPLFSFLSFPTFVSAKKPSASPSSSLLYTANLHYFNRTFPKPLGLSHQFYKLS